LAVCLSYYYLCIGRKPQLVAGPKSKFTKFLLDHCSILEEPFWPTPWCFGGRAQTIIGSLLKSHPIVKYRRELLQIPDGGELFLDWLDNGSLTAKSSNTFPTVLILPGLTGTSQHGYVLHFVKEIEQLGYRAVVLNNRGLGGARLRTPRAFCAANTEDLEFVISHIHNTYPGIPLIAVAVSLGGIILTNYLSKFSGENFPGLLAAMTISVPWDLFRSADSLEEPVNSLLLNRHLANLLCKLVRDNTIMVEALKEDKPNIRLNHILQSRTVREFDNRLIAPMFGFKDSSEYYAAASLHSKPLHLINIPLLCLSAEDDPFAPVDTLPLDKIKSCPNVVMVLTSRGGHIGYTEGLIPSGRGYADRLMSQYVKSIIESGHLLNAGETAEVNQRK
ncbi:predicted protein, partial [Nematostella vectensis]